MKTSHDTALGSFFVAIGGVAFLMALDYPFGTTGRMGPGYFPVIVSSMLVLVGVAVLLRGRLAGSPPIGSIRWKPLLIAPAAIALFGLMIEPLGLPLAILLLVIGSATASVKFRLDWKATLGAVAFSALCSAVFIKLLGLPIPLAGSWLRAVGLF